MKKLRIFVVMMLCVSLLAFAGCGNNDTEDDARDNGTVTEETTDTKDGNYDDREDGDSLTEDMAEDAEDVVDDARDNADGKSSNRDDATKETEKK